MSTQPAASGGGVIEVDDEPAPAAAPATAAATTTQAPATTSVPAPASTPREIRKPREGKEREARDTKEVKDSKDPKPPQKDAKETKETKDPKEHREHREHRVSKETRDTKDGKDARSAGGGAGGAAPAARPAAPAAAAPASSPAPAASAAATAGAPAAKAPAKAGLSEEVLGQVAQAKLEAQEERLRDVARHAMALLRDYSKLGAPECARKVAEVRKALLKYELQYVRVSELQERRRRAEVQHLEEDAKRFRQEVEEEAGKITELHQVLEKERRRRKRYEGYEALATDVNRKKTRSDSQAEIEAVKADIARLRRQRSELEASIELRNQHAQLLRHAAAELTADLQQERARCSEILANGAQGGEKSSKAAAAPGALPVEVIS